MPTPPHVFHERLTEALRALPPAEPAEPSSPAAVLLALFWRDGGPWVWLLERASHLRHHPGQISLPGGKPDPEDPDLWATALREAHEEIGLPPPSVRLLGQLPARMTSTRFLVRPFVGAIDDDFSPRFQPSEVARVFAAPVSDFSGEGQLRTPPTAPERGPVPSYLSQGSVVWGATAAILARLAAVCTDIDQ